MESDNWKKIFSNLRYDFPSGLAVFLVAVPLCLGVASASGAPIFSGIISAIIGGIIVGIFSKSPLSVSGPAAGLTIIVLDSIKTLGSFNGFLLALLFAGIIQLLLGVFKVGGIADYLPSSVINGMLSSIGIMLLIKQLPVMTGFLSGSSLNTGSMIIGLCSLAVIYIWDKYFYAKFKFIPSALLAVIAGIAINYFYGMFYPSFYLASEYLVNLPVTENLSKLMMFPDWSKITNIEIYKVAFSIAMIASIETLLSLEAVEKLDPLKRKASANKELIAQGIGNALSGLTGGIPITSVIVRGTVNISAGAVSKMSTIIHGFLLLISVILFSKIINMIPLATLASILVFTGYKLTSPQVILINYQKGKQKFIPFLVTVFAILLTDLLDGVVIGLGACIIYTLKKYHDKKIYSIIDSGKSKTVVLEKNITFFHKKQISDMLKNLPENSIITIDGSKTEYIHYDVLDTIYDFKINAPYKNISLNIHNLTFIEVNGTVTH